MQSTQGGRVLIRFRNGVFNKFVSLLTFDTNAKCGNVEAAECPHFLLLNICSIVCDLAIENIIITLYIMLMMSNYDN